MKYTAISMLLLPALLQAQPFEFVQEWDSVQIAVDGYVLPQAWSSGYIQSAPSFCDIDGDGDLDLLLGQAWQVLFWLNQGTSQEEDFQLDENGLQEINNDEFPAPEFVDIDADGDLDLFLYGWTLGMQVYRNQGSITTPMFTLIEDSLKDIAGNAIYGAGYDLADIDDDRDYDLFIGEYYTGRIHFYRNIGDSTTYAFQLEDSFFAGVQAGYWSSPEFCDLDADGDLDMFVGNEWGHVWYYRNDGTPQQWNYTYVTDNWLDIWVGDRADPEFCDIDDDGDYDLFLGKDNENSLEPPGDIHFWRNNGTAQIPQFVQENQMYLIFDLGRDLADPEFVDIDQDNKEDMYLFYYYLGWMRNIGSSSSPYFQMISYSLLTDPWPAVTGGAGFGDLNSDGHEDIVITHAWSGVIDFSLSNGDTANPGFDFLFQVDWGEFHGAPALGDLDADGDVDMLIPGGDFVSGGLRYYENQGTPQHFNFVLMDSSYQNLGAGEPVLVDFDGDEDLDLLSGLSYPDYRITYYQNQGTPAQANMVLITEDLMGLPCLTVGMPDFFDIDNDGDMDAIGGTVAGGLLFFRNVTGETPAVPPPLPRTAPYRGPVLAVGPNPANPVTTFSFKLRVASSVNLTVYDVSGRRVAELLSGRQEAGAHVVTWDASGLGSGVYLARLQVGQETQAGKVVVVK